MAISVTLVGVCHFNEMGHLLSKGNSIDLITPKRVLYVITVRNIHTAQHTVFPRKGLLRLVRESPVLTVDRVG